MKTYSALIHLAGNQLNQVRRSGLIAADIHILRHIHGSDAVHEVKEEGDNPKLKQSSERGRLANFYGAKHLEAVFGKGIAPLPYDLDDEQLGSGPAVEVGYPDEDENRPQTLTPDMIAPMPAKPSGGAAVAQAAAASSLME